MNANVTYTDWGSATSNSLGPVFGVLVALGGMFALVGLAFAAAYMRGFFQRVQGAARFFVLAAEYFVVGLCALLPLASVGYGSWYVATHATRSGSLGFLKWGAVVLGAFVLVSAFGYFVEKWWARVKANAKPASSEAKA